MRLERALCRLLNRPTTRSRGAAGGYRVGTAHTVIGTRPADATLAWAPAQHTFICGRTGTGKTTFLLRLMAEHLRASVPFLFIDFHGTATDQILALAASLKTRSPLVLLEPWSDPVIGFNPLDAQGESPYPVVQELVGVFHHRLWPDAWGPRLEELLRMTLLALAETSLTLLEAPRFLSMPEFRRAVLSKVSLSEVRDFWTLRFERLSPSQKSLVTETVLNKLSFFQDPVLRYLVGQQPGSLDLDQALATGQTILVNLSAGRLWGSNLLLGALLVAKLKAAVYRRPSDSGPYAVILDEFQEMVGLDVLDDYLRSFRKFGCSVYLATQHLQLTPEIRASIFGNCQRFCSFATGYRDAGFLGAEFGPPEGKLIPQMLPDLPTGTAVLKVRGQSPVILRVQPPAVRVTAELAAAGRGHALAQGRSRDAIDAECRERIAAVSPSRPARVRTGGRRTSAVALEDALAEGYEH